MNENKLADWLENNYDKRDREEEPELSHVLDVVSQWEAPAMDAEKVFAEISEQIKPGSHNAGYKVWQWMTAAAALVVICLFVYQFCYASIVVDTDIGQQKVYALTDGSQVMLNGQSEIRFSRNFNSERIIHLKGEAFFDVVKGSTFTVMGDNGSVEVLGTSFNVYDRNDKFYVACQSGKVKVETQQASRIILPGQSVSKGKDQLLVDTIRTESVGGWRSGESFFSNRPLSEVVEALKAQYNVKIKPLPSEIENEHFTGSFIHNDLRKAVKMVFLPMGVSYEWKDNHTVIIK